MCIRSLRRRLKPRRTALLALPLVVLAGAASCGGSDTEKVDADDWVDDICDATGTLADAEDDAYNAYFDIESDDADEIRDALSDYVDDYAKALDKFARAVERAGEPDVDHGDRMVKAVQGWVEEEKKYGVRAERDARSLKTVDEIDQVFSDMKLANLLDFLDDTDSRDTNDIVELFDDNESCSNFLFVD